MLFIVGGTLPIVYLSWLGVRHLPAGATLEKAQPVLFVERARSPQT